ncbi:MAG: TIGR01212 family radical SAM protein [Bacteroidales bacterium]|nr:TIGR01212 family radical SAM protein [Bacteroidales bacterium]
MIRPFNDFSGFFKSLFDERVQKISIDAGFTCPNRDGTKGRGGCSFCDNKTFNPAYCLPENSITDQLNQGINFFKTRYPGQKYLAYFQAYTNTYGDLEMLKSRYEEALMHPEVIGLVIGTRPDCIDEELVNYLDKLTEDYFVSLEFGIESTLDATLLRINRGHDFKTSIQALEMCQTSRFYTGVHMILGLPGESKQDILNQTDQLNKLSFDFLKLHQMQIIRGTKLEYEYASNPQDFTRMDVDEYIDLLITYLEKLKPEIVIERFISESPLDKLIAPRWGLKNFEFVAKLEKEMIRRQTFQGKSFIVM